MSVFVTVDADGEVAARRSTDQEVIPGRGCWTGLEADLIRVFERWLAERDRTWLEDELSAFGRLLHGSLFARPEMWEFVRSAISANDGEVTRLRLGFPGDGPYARYSSRPWEFLYRPDSNTSDGFLAGSRRLVLSRFVDGLSATVEPKDRLTVMVVVSQPKDRRLGSVAYAPTIEAIKKAAETIPLTVVEPVHLQPTADDLIRWLADADETPDIVHFMGHGLFDAARGTASMILSDRNGLADSVDDRTFASILTRAGSPTAVVLHSCDAGRGDFELGFLGVAPQLVLQGVPYVVAMQYPVRNSTATQFSVELYEQLAQGKRIDEAAQAARWRIRTSSPDRSARLLGIPVVYAQSDVPLLAAVRSDP